MANCFNYIDDYIELGCEIETGSVVAIAFIDKSKTFTDISDPSEWVASSTNQILIFPEIRGYYEAVDPTEIPGKGRQDLRIVGRRHEMDFVINSSMANWDFWNKMNKTRNYKIAFVVGSNYDLLMYSNTVVNIDAGIEVETNIDTEVDYWITLKWSDKILLNTANVPPGIFKTSYNPIIANGTFDEYFDEYFE